ncbi:S10 family peptidase [Desulforhabdus amnigena]|uniref:Peptidase S10 n=1 Tax=Desulforhabdus amnigena TaxID=40218 RepID=A0A9W6FTV5_9BACT|nr:hypothetical protein [Desulforhabdus amnigena]GLI34326.1 peptidase S10 [Desulforhabdus amnigena]
MRYGTLFVAVLLLLQAATGFAQDRKAAQEKAPTPAQDAAADEAGKESAREEPSVTRHSLKIDGKIFNYTATAGRMPLKDDSTGKVKANLFFIAYVVDGKDVGTGRPITFVFNGGPGSSSVWLHLGAVGPRRIVMEDGNVPLLPPYKVVENFHSWLPATDLVFIDPVGTGFSRPAQGEAGKQFYGLKEDIQWVGDFIRLYTTRYGRWLSPKFLAGESYGTYRAVGLADYLYENFGMDFNGLVLISLALDFQAFSYSPGNDLPYVTFLPSYTAAAWYHKKLSPDLQENLQNALSRAEAWAGKEYLHALVQGDTLEEKEREEIAQGLERYTGLKKSFIRYHNLRINRSDFMNELLRDENLSVGLLDARLTRKGESTDFLNDPGMALATGPYVAALNDYVRKELKYETDLPYIFLSEEVNDQWDWGSRIRGYVSILEPLKNVLTRSRRMKVFAACGYYDLDTPYMGSRYSLSHLGLDAELQKNISIGYYEGGHMLYTQTPVLEKLSADVTAFIKSAVAGTAESGK